MIVYRLSLVKKTGKANNRIISDFVLDKEFYKLDRLAKYKATQLLAKGQEWDITIWEVWGRGDYREHDYRGQLNPDTLKSKG